jgi:hypothetical protein
MFEKSIFSPAKYRFTAAIASVTSGVGVPGSALGSRRSRLRSVSAAFRAGNRSRVTPAPFQAMPQKPPATSKIE